VSFGRRLALFFLLIAIVPTAALIGILVFVTHDSAQGKADARLSAGLETAQAIYGRHLSQARIEAHRLAKDPELAIALRSHNARALNSFTQRAVKGPSVVRVEVLDVVGRALSAAGPQDAIAFASVGLTDLGTPVGALRVSTATAAPYVEEVRQLTNRQLVLSRGGSTLASTIPPPAAHLEPDETADLTVEGTPYRAHMAALDRTDDENLLLLGPPKEGGLFGIGGPALGILIWFLFAAVVLSWGLARTLTRLHARVEAQALTDPLTGLWNRRYMAETLEREVARAQRFRHPISLIILDVDDFKKINDRDGHLQGDIVLERVADVVRDVTRSIDVAARYGGDELALILVETDREGATVLAERLRERVGATQIPLREDETMGVTLSVGVSTIPDSAADLESLVDAADRALLRSKRAGKNQIRTAPVTRPGRGSGESRRKAEDSGRRSPTGS
jgi:diguanylate cyclase (GGDEF)-like protein